MQRVALINGENINQDYDLSKIFQSLAFAGVGKGLEVVDGKVTPGYAFINISRDNEEFSVLFQNTSDVTIDTTGTKKVFIELDQSKIDDGSANSSNGTGIGEIKTADNYPTSNYIKLASITSGIITDEREKIIHRFENLSGNTANLIVKSDGKIEIQQANKDLGSLEVHSVNILDIFLDGAGIGTANGLVKTDSENRLIGDGSLLTGVIAESEKVFIKGLIPAFSVGEGIYPLRKGYKKGEDTSKVYIFDKSAGDMESVGFYFGETDGFDDPESFFGGKQGEVYGPNIFG
ncbi:MAG: hypothetical protein GY828_06270, partial [Candidatus Gracilibacteria bacterium]|nr:hypothetical protein [Candidatus Gracilibacteria bacterium]